MADLFDILYEQHRRVFELLALLRREIDAFARADAFDSYVVDGTLEYIAEYPDKLHRPIELRMYTAYRQRLGKDDPLAVAAAAAEHDVLSAQARELKRTILAIEKDAVMSRDAIAADARRFIDGLARHMDYEEREIFPAVRAVLSPAELAAIRQAAG